MTYDDSHDRILMLEAQLKSATDSINDYEKRLEEQKALCSDIQDKLENAQKEITSLELEKKAISKALSSEIAELKMELKESKGLHPCF
jgi:predicted RNase H-like nuclease (RuvC/YqgF family)